jgi:hypothetical protein
MAWKPGESGNPEGRALNKPFLDAVSRAIAQDDGKRLRKAAEQLLDAADAGEPWALQMLADRLDGKPKQQVEASGADGGPLVVEIVRFGKD